MTTVLVIDDHPVVLQGCKRFLEEAGVASVWTSSSFSKGFQLYRQHTPNLLVVDLAVHSGVLGGLTFVQRLRVHDKQTPVIIFSMHSDPVIVSKAVGIGANGYLMKETWHDEFMAAFKEVLGGGTYISREIASDLAYVGVCGSSNPLHQLSMRELQVLSMISKGHTYRSIAEDLELSQKTIANIAAEIKAKLAAENVAEMRSIANKSATASIL